MEAMWAGGRLCEFMKKLLIGLMLISAVLSSAGQGQGTAVRSLNGLATNFTTVGVMTNGPGATAVHLNSGTSAAGAGDLLSFIGTNGLFRILIAGTNIFFRDTNNVQLRISPMGVEAQGAGFIGNGAGLTNIPSSAVVGGQTPWTSDINSAGFNLTNSGETFFIYDSNGVTRVYIGQDTTDFVDRLGRSRVTFDQDGIGGATALYDGLGYSRFNAQQGGGGNGATSISDASNTLRIVIETETQTGATYFLDSSGGIQVEVRTNGMFLTQLVNAPGLATKSDGQVVHSGSTNTWGNAVVPFDRGPNLRTNMAGNLTITGVTGFQNDVYNTVYIRLNPGASDRTLVVPNEWMVGTNTVVVNAFTNTTTATIAANTFAWLMVECLPGIETNAWLLSSIP